MKPEDYAKDAMLFMRSKAPGPDGQIDYVAKKDSDEWRDWHQYFIKNGMHKKASLMRTLQQFMVPCADPREFDMDYRALKPLPDKTFTMSAEEREKLATRLVASLTAPRQKKSPTWKPEENPMPEARNFTKEELASWARLASVPSISGLGYGDAAE
jgi:hypothetical protein